MIFITSCDLLLLFSRWIVSESSRPHRLQHSGPLCPSPSPEICPSSCPWFQWCHPVISSSDTLFSFSPQSFPASGTFRMSSLHQMTKMLEFQLQHQSFQQVFRVDFPWDWLAWSYCPRDFQESSPAPPFKGINYSVLRLLYGPALTTVHDHWEDHSLDYTDLCQQSNVSAFQHTV